MADARRMGKAVAPPSSVNSSTESNTYVRFAADRQTSLLLDNHTNFRSTAELNRIMFYDVDGSWVNYPEEILNLAKCRFKEGIPAVEVAIAGRNMLLDFYRMVEVDFESGFERSIGWMDVTGRYSFPKTSVNSAREFGVDEFEKVEKVAGKVKPLDDGDEATSKRRREGDDPEVDMVGPSNKKYEVCVHNNMIPVARWLGTTILVEGLDDEFDIAKKHFLDGLGKAADSATVTGVHQCIKDDLTDTAFTRLTAAVRQKRGDANVTVAWYGASPTGIGRFLATGELSPEDLNLSSHRGVGAYLSPASRSRFSTLFAERDEGGEMHVVLCQVILGASEQVTDSTQVFPSSPAFDTGVDDVENPKWYVVWPADRNTHISPEVVVSFRGGLDFFPDIPRNAPCLASTFGEYAVVVSKVGKTLPVGPARELQQLFSQWKKGNIVEEVFAERLGGFVDHGRLRTMLEEIRRGRAAG